MELELGVKLTRIADEFTSDFKIAKDRAGPVFLSHETDVMFVLTAHLKGYRRTNIKININEDGDLITISGEKQVQDTVIVGWKIYKNDIETKGFKKVFKIPKGVILDKINANFVEDESTLTISMPKKVKGIQGISLEEVNENQELVREGSSGSSKIEDAQTKKTDNSGEQNDVHMIEKPSSESTHKDEAKESPTEDGKREKTVGPIQEHIEPKRDQESEHVEQEHQGKGDQVSEIANYNGEQVLDEDLGNHTKSVKDLDKPRGESSLICTPIAVGSALLLSFVVFVFHIMRSKSQDRRKD